MVRLPHHKVLPAAFGLLAIHSMAAISRRHICFVEAETTMRDAAIEIIPDSQPIDGWRRLYVRDPGGNRIEIAERSGD